MSGDSKTVFNIFLKKYMLQPKILLRNFSINIELKAFSTNIYILMKILIDFQFRNM